jgi:Tfp pilus assembly protein FimT
LKPQLQISVAPRRVRRAGFSLIELMGVVIVLGLIVGVVAVDWASLVPRSQLNAAVRELASTIQGARSDAIARNGVFTLVYDLQGNRYEVRSPYRPGGGMARNEEERVVVRHGLLVEGIQIERVEVDGRSFTGESVVVNFDPIGRANGHSVTLVQPRFDQRFTIEVIGLTGLVRFHDGDFLRGEVFEEDF